MHRIMEKGHRRFVNLSMGRSDMDLITAAYTNTGSRSKNEDFYGCFQILSKFAVWVVADGLGGHSDGEVASKLAVESVLAAYQANPEFTEMNIRSVIHSANRSILTEQQQGEKYTDMYTTIVALFTNYSDVFWAHVGDSRLYLFRNGTVRCQTEDHSVSQLAVTAGEISREQIRFHEDRNKIFRVLGSGPKLNVEIHKPIEPIIPGDAFLLCTDGFWEYVHETEMEADLKNSVSPDKWLELMSLRLIRKVSGNHDNYTAVAVFAV